MRNPLPFYDIDSLENRNESLLERAVGWVEQTLTRYHRAEVFGTERVPTGAALYVGNHNGGAYSGDSFIFGAAVHREHGPEALPYGLGHEWVLGLPGLNQLLCPLGAVRASHENALRLLGAGKKVLVYPGGDLDSTRPFRRRNLVVFGGRRGYVRLALTAGVPVVPVVAAGAHSTFVVLDDLRWLSQAVGLDRRIRLKTAPAVLSLPLGLTVGIPPLYLPLPSRMLIEVMEPIRFDRTGEDAARDDDYVLECAWDVESRMQECLDRLSALRKKRKKLGIW